MVGHDEHPLSSVRRTGMDSTHHERPAGVPEFFQVTEDDIGSPSAESRDVLSDDPTGSGFSNNPKHLFPESTSFSFDPGTLPGARYVLAREAPHDRIDRANVGGV
jgi:hypothetical protein